MTFRTWCKKMCAILGLVGSECRPRKAPSIPAARAVAPLFETVQLLDFGRCKLCIAVPDGFEYSGVRTRLHGQAHRNHLSAHSRDAFLADHGVTAEVVVLSGSVEIAPRFEASGSDLRSGIDRFHSGGESPASSPNRTRQSGGAHPYSRYPSHRKRNKNGLDVC